MSVLSGWSLSGPRFDTIQDWTSLNNVQPTKSKKSLRRSASSGVLSSSSSRSLSSSPSATALLSSSPSSTSLLSASPGVGSGGLGSRGTSASASAHSQGQLASSGGSSRVPGFVFAANPYQVSRQNLNNSIAGALAASSPNTPNTHHQYAIHQLPRNASTMAASPSASPARSASSRHANSSSPIPIPAGSPLPISPNLSNGSSHKRLPHVGAQFLLAQQLASRGIGVDSAGFNPYLLSETQLSSSPSSPSLLAGRRGKNIDQRLAEYLKPGQHQQRMHHHDSSPNTPHKGVGRHRRSSSGHAANGGGGSNINVAIVPHPRNVMNRGGMAGGQDMSPELAAQSGGKDREEKEPHPDESHMSPADRRRKSGAAAAATSMAGNKRGGAASTKKGKRGTGGGLSDEEDESSLSLPAIETTRTGKSASTDGKSTTDSGAHLPASMNLKAVLKQKKAAEAAAKEEEEKEKEMQKPWTGVTWTDVLQARQYLIQQSKNKKDQKDAHGHGPNAVASDTKNPVHQALNQSLAMQVAQHLLSQGVHISGSGPDRGRVTSHRKVAFNIYSLSEFQRSEYKMASEQAKWMQMYPKEEMSIKARPAGSANKPEAHKELPPPPTPIPNDQKKSSTKTRQLNLCRTDGRDNGQPQASAAVTAAATAGGLTYNTYVTCNGQYGYVRFLGRVPWASGLWVGMELVEKHPWACYGLGAWVDFYHETSSVALQTFEDGPDPRNPDKGKKDRARSAHGHGHGNDHASSQPHVPPPPQMMINTSIPRPMVLCAMLPPSKDSKKAAAESSKVVYTADDGGILQPLSASIFPFIDVVCFLRDGLHSCFDLGEYDPALLYMAPSDSVKRVAQKPKIDSKTLLQHKEQQSNPFAAVDELACSTPKKHEGNIDMLSRYLTVSDRETLDGDRNKARAIFRWICHNIRVDHTIPFGSKSMQDCLGIIRYRKANAEGFANLFHALCVAGGLACIRIRGVEKALNPRTDQVVRNKHCWNAIKVDGEWTFVDCVASCGQWVYSDAPTPTHAHAASKNGREQQPQHVVTFHQMFSDAYFCTPPSLFILEHFPTDSPDHFNKMLPSEYNNLQLLRSVVSAAEFERGLIPGRAFVEYHMRAAPFTYAIDCKQPSYQIELTAPSFILFDVDLKLKSHVVDLSQCSHIQYDGEQVTIFLIFPVPGEYVCRITCKPSWRELDIYDNCLSYRLTSHSGLVPLSQNKDVIIGFLQHKKINARDSRSQFNRHFTLLHPLSGHLIPKAPFMVQIKGPDIADSVVVACNGDWQRLNSASLGKTGVKMFEGTCIIQPRYELQIFYEMDKKFFLLYSYKANLTSFSNVYLANRPKSSSTQASQQQDLWHGKCVLGIEGRAFDASLSLDVPSCRFGRQTCTFILHVSTAWDIGVQLQEGWKNGTPLPDSSVLVEEMKNARSALMTQYRVTCTLPAAASIDDRPSTGSNRATSAGKNGSRPNPMNNDTSVVPAPSASPKSSSSSSSPDALDSASRKPGKDSNKLPISAGVEVEEPLKASTQFVLVVNARNSKQGGPMRYCMSYFLDVARTAPPVVVNQNTQQMQIEVM